MSTVTQLGSVSSITGKRKNKCRWRFLSVRTVHTHSPFPFRELCEGRALLTSPAQSEAEAQKATAGGSHGGNSEVRGLCPAPGAVSRRPAGRSPGTHACPSPRTGCAGRLEQTMVAALTGTARPRVLPASRTENSAAWPETPAGRAEGGAHSRAAFSDFAASWTHVPGGAPCRLLQNYTSQTSPRPRAPRENSGLGFLGGSRAELPGCSWKGARARGWRGRRYPLPF